MALIDNLQDPGTDPIFGIQTEYRKDERDFKVNLTCGVYVDAKGGKPPIMKALKEAEERILKEESTKTYLGIAGDQEYLSLTAKLVFGELDQDMLSMIQTVGGTSALRTGFELLRKNGYSHVSVSNPTWANHLQILQNLDFDVNTYDHRKAAVNFSIFEEHLRSLPAKSVVLLQARNHNPTGIDFTKEQWMSISAICKKKEHYTFFDSAYQGFADSLGEDTWSIKYFIQEGHDLMVAHSFSKSFAVYNERVGALFVANKDKEAAGLVKRNLMRIARVTYSNPPSHGASAVKLILKNSELYEKWLKELNSNRDRINSNRKKFAEELKSVFNDNTPKEIKEGSGFFCQVPLSKEEINRLKEEYGIYMTGSGRVSLPGLNDTCFTYVIDSLKKLKE